MNVFSPFVAFAARLRASDSLLRRLFSPEITGRRARDGYHGITTLRYLTGEAAFVPLDPAMCACMCAGDVYDFAHIAMPARDRVRRAVRLLRHLYGETHVTYVRNITDVDDKINDRAARISPACC